VRGSDHYPSGLAGLLMVREGARLPGRHTGEQRSVQGKGGGVIKKGGESIVYNSSTDVWNGCAFATRRTSHQAESEGEGASPVV